MKIKIQKLLSLSFFISKQILQCNTQAVNTNNSNPSPSNQQQSNNQNASGIPDEQLKTFSYGAEEFTMAIIGDSGAEKESKEVMKLTTFDALLHLGDYDYECVPNKYFDTILDSSRSYQFMGILGNHEGRIIGLSAEVNGADKREEQLSFLKKNLDGATEDWKICSWHFYDKYYHTGKYPEDSERNIISGSGEKLMLCQNLRPLLLIPMMKKTNESIVQIRKGATLDILNGAGGYEMYIEQGEQKDYSHWLKKYAKGSSGENAKKYGGLFCKFNHEGNPKKAYCEFLRINSTYKVANNIADTISADAESSSSSSKDNKSGGNGKTSADADAKSNFVLNSKNIVIGGSVCAALVVVGGGIFIFSKRSKKSISNQGINIELPKDGNDPSLTNINVDLSKDYNNQSLSDFTTQKYNFSSDDSFYNGDKNNTLNTSFLPISNSAHSQFYKNQNSTQNDYNSYDRSFGKGNNSYDYSNYSSNSKPTNYKNEYNMNKDTEPLVVNNYRNIIIMILVVVPIVVIIIKIIEVMTVMMIPIITIPVLPNLDIININKCVK
ncbi:hypothetical protein LY90DRAFT_519065 [Neocallimastix californiae]|uniref:Uncharacterized protein n=1 Tax=Neocallimastix californiae TaxID=1754190 RepID=A0A1Y1ZCQ0_9FUNG|nr:hypothetical protein LY90DRAFT_519065 [Neocallimastix californiae]|eukprot:ORY08028.1 hypothetical protein LY90DRAFT_519065 [Neocallimastix californiae]